MSESKSQAESGDLRLLYRRVFLSSFGSGLISPFIPIYAAQLGASSTEIGLVQAINSVSPSIAQIPWGFIIDKARRRVIFLSLSGLLYSLLLLFLFFADNPIEFIVVVLLAYVFSAMASPALNSLLGEFSGVSGRGKILAKLNAMASFGHIPATVLSGYIIYRVGGTVREMYRIPLFLCFLFNIASSMVTLKIREPSFSQESFSVRGWVKALKVNVYFKRLCLLSIFQGFSMGLAWPLFTLTVVRVVRADMFQISLLSVVSASTAIVARRFTGRLADRAGRKPLIVLGRMGLFLIPLIYAFASSIYELIIVNFIVGILTASSDVALSAYLLDISPRNMRASYISIYNAVAGSFSFLGSTIGGYLMDTLMSMGFDFHSAMMTMYAISIFGRLFSGLLYVTIQEPYKYPAKFEEEIKRIFEEEVEAMERIISTYRRIEDEDLEWFERLSEMSQRR
ncbi:MFS transporter [Candidatus Bathyarchaeota archaeon]|nr:MFS transporter [Candidatus Bathyarchaeota archaeon]